MKNLNRAKLITFRVESRQSAATAPAFNLLHLHLEPSMWGVTPFEFCRDFRHQKTRVSGLSFGDVCVILRLAISVEHRPVTDRQTDGRTDGQTDIRRQLILALASIAQVKMASIKYRTRTNIVLVNFVRTFDGLRTYEYALYKYH